MKMGGSLLLYSCIAAVIALKASLSQGNILLVSFLTNCQTLFVTVCHLKGAMPSTGHYQTTYHLLPLFFYFMTRWVYFDSEPLKKMNLNEICNWLNVLFLWFAAIMTSPTLKARQCELMAPLPPSQSALCRPQLNKLQFKTNISTSLWALSLFSNIIHDFLSRHLNSLVLVCMGEN